MSYVVGCDFDTRAIHLVYLDENGEEPPRYEYWALRGADAFTRTRDVRTVMHLCVGTLDDVIAFGIEHPAGTHGSQVLMRVQGAILACLRSNLLVKDWPPGKWRKAVGLPGNASKAAVKAWVDSWVLVMETPGTGGLRLVKGFPQDACDAYCIALATLQALEREAAA